MKRILVADRSAHARAALRLLLEQLPGVASVGEANTSATCLDALAGSATDVLLLDWSLPEAPAEPWLSGLRLLYPGVCIVVLSTRPEHSRAALTAGADIFVCKGDAPQALLASLALESET